MAELENWRTFVQVVDSGSFSKAAAQMNVARSAVSRRVSELERKLGVNLIRRTTRTLSITTTGTELYEHARRLIGEFEELEATTVKGHADAKGAIRFSAPVSFTVRHLQPTLERYRQTYPAVTLELILGDRRVDMIGDGFDFALRIGAEIEPSLAARRLCAIEHVLAASPGYLQRHGMPQHPTDLHSHCLLSYGNSSKPRSLSFESRTTQERVDIRFDPRLICNNGEFLVDCARRGDGIVCNPTFLVHADLCDAGLSAVLSDWKLPQMHAYLVYPAHRRLPARVRLLMDMLIDALPDPAPWDQQISRHLALRANHSEDLRRPT